ncbi:MAG: ABC transporter ATP-binding protein [Pseudomonadota bacterium]
MLVLNDISKQFGGVRAVSNVSFEVSAGEVRGLIGPNGAGKTTLINLISGLLTPTSGTMSLDGDILDGTGAAARTRKGIARTFQNLRIFENLSVGQNIEVAQITARSEGHEDSTAIGEAVERFDLAGKLHMPADALSYGHLRRLEIVRALALNPKVLMLDEPAAGMNEQETEELAGALDWVKTRFGCATLVIDHDLKFIMTLCDRITVLNMGAVIAEGTPREITTNQDVIDAYLGEDHSNAA